MFYNRLDQLQESFKMFKILPDIEVISLLFKYAEGLLA